MIYVCRFNRAYRKHIRLYIKNLLASKGELLGVVLNGLSPRRIQYYSNYRYYRSYKNTTVRSPERGRRFLRDALRPPAARLCSHRPIALIAGRGSYPALTAAAIRRAGVPLRLVAIDDETDPALFATFPESERVSINVGQIGKMLSALKDFGAGYALMAGQVKPKRLFHGLSPDLKAAQILLTLKRRNAETIFGAIAAEIEKLGVTLLDARAFSTISSRRPER